MTSQSILRIGDQAPNFKAASTHGPIDFYEWHNSSWSILFSHPADFTPVCTTELGEFAKNQEEFSKRNTKLIGISVNELDDHQRWIKDVDEVCGCRLNYPLIADSKCTVSALYGMVDQLSLSKGNPYTVRSLFFIDPSKIVRAIISYPASTGRNINEIIRVLDSLQLSDKYKVATPVNWTPGEDVRFDVSDEDAKDLFKSIRTVKPYLRFTPDPSAENKQHSLS